MVHCQVRSWVVRQADPEQLLIGSRNGSMERSAPEAAAQLGTEQANGPVTEAARSFEAAPGLTAEVSMLTEITSITSPAAVDNSTRP